MGQARQFGISEVDNWRFGDTAKVFVPSSTFLGGTEAALAPNSVRYWAGGNAAQCTLTSLGVHGAAASCLRQFASSVARSGSSASGKRRSPY